MCTKTEYDKTEKPSNKHMEIWTIEEETVNFEWIEGYVVTAVGKVPKVSNTLSRKDKLGTYKVRWGIQRYEYKIPPGLYAIGEPSEKSPVLVTANYKFSFDMLRKELQKVDAWILVLDTNGINVWCAAGKGTFGTYELVKRIHKVQLKKIINHKTLIVPQLGAVGVAAHSIAKTGFHIVYGPVRAEDIVPFLSNNFQATKEMRTVTFTFKERLALTPMEIIPGMKYVLPLILLFFVFHLLSIKELGVSKVIVATLMNFIPFFGALLVGAFFVPILLPYIPFASFALKGLTLGIFWTIFSLKFHNTFLFPNSVLIYVGNALLTLAICAYTALNFTGSTTYTSLSGTVKETVITIPIVLGAAFIGLLLWIIQIGSILIS